MTTWTRVLFIYDVQYFGNTISDCSRYTPSDPAMRDSRGGWTAPVGEMLPVRFPDGKVVHLKLVGKNVGPGVSWAALGFYLPVHGLDLWVPIESVEVILPTVPSTSLGSVGCG
jgi:hypothetical protein